MALLLQGKNVSSTGLYARTIMWFIQLIALVMSYLHERGKKEKKKSEKFYPEE